MKDSGNMEDFAKVDPGVDPRAAFLVLNALPDIGPITTRRLLNLFGGDVCSLFQADAKELCAAEGVGPKTAERVVNWREYFNLKNELAAMQRSEVGYVSCADTDYPELLQRLNDAPLGLYWRGEYRVDRPCIAIIGTRRSTLYGAAVARRFASELAKLGFCIVSGMARGTDTAAHEGALALGGKTIAVFGCGLKTVYPPENLELCRQIVKTGAVVSEFPLDRRGDRQTFPMRNRIVAGMSEAVIVIESDVSGGSMITARFAGEQGRHVFAVPGRIDQAASRGCHQLIRDGAILVTSVDDILEELNYRKRDFQLDMDLADESHGSPNAVAVQLSESEQKLWEQFGNGEAHHPDSLVASLDMQSWEISGLLIQLELKKLLVKRTDGRYEARA